MAIDIENADSGHVADEVNARVAEADQAAHRAYTAAESLANLTGSLNYTSDPIGSDIRRVVESAMGNQIGDLNSLVASLDEFQGQIRAAQSAQQGIDGEAAESLDMVDQKIR
ncbi:type VII secretion target [Segniliparus rugosus]|uniref:Uncharacterized protein n=1 Tax=Segniliparus rugosus (strain ATCC BAA-974 / DSM 45345 / CCUG 50838 / CIP 108380 / JCM 13579 / CDC 945) TaxID=679197 RepID=E5XUM9_SEGRC|nr:hypothetical protein [Segniliparus rugosus]EFV11953.1 hypothetical protein HMPREF9336_03201 [Segniliparus rugosus ATCC BAA-974]